MSSTRIVALDLLKWVAIVTMVIDHAVYLAPESLSVWHVPGRVAFPLFCLVIATHVFRQQPGQLASPSNWAWAKKLLIYGCIAQPAFTLYIGSATGDIMFTLVLGLALALAYQHRSTFPVAPLMFLGVLAFSFKWQTVVSYGLWGVLLPVAFLYALTKRTFETWLVPAFVAFGANVPDAGMLFDLVIDPVATASVNMLTIAGAFVAGITCWVGLFVCRQTISFRVPAVAGWAYGFYPAHLIVFALLGLSHF